jgi:antitoxin VapB
MLLPMLKSRSILHDQGRRVAIFRNGVNQAIRIPREFELPSSVACLFRDGDSLVIECIPNQPSLLRTLEKLEPLDESFPDVDANLLPAGPVDLP